MAFGKETAAGTTQAHKYVRPEVEEYLLDWKRIRDCIKGQRRIKARTTTYLPKPNAADTSAENTARYQAYVERSVFYNVTGRTLKGFVGHVFAKLPVIELPPELEGLRNDVDGLGVPIEQQAQKVLSRLLALGRGGLLADFPPTNGPTSREDLRNGEVKPSLAFYEPESIINWRVATVGSKKLLTLLVLTEEREDSTKSDEFSRQTKPAYRILRLEEDGNYSVEVIVDTVSEGKTYPLDSTGKNFKEIPFVFLGSENNDPTPDEAPLLDLADLNIAHYRNSADYEESSFLVGQPTPVVSGLSKDWALDVLKGTIMLGSRGLVPLPVGGRAELMQASPNTMPKEAMEHKERQMVALGARLVELRSVQRTAQESGQDEEVETSILINSARNVSLGYFKALRWAGMFVGASGAARVELNTDFAMARMTVEERAQLIAEWQAEAVGFTEMRRGLRVQGTAYMEEAEVKADIKKNPPPKDSPGSAAAEIGKRAPQPNSGGDS